MTTCSKYRELFVPALYDEISGEERRPLEEHLQECEKCTAEFEQMKKTAGFMSRRKRELPSDEYWESFEKNLQGKLKSESAGGTLHPQKKKNLIQLFQAAPAWSYQLAAAIVLIALGVFIGRTFFRSADMHPTQIAQKKGVENSLIQRTAVDNRAYNYIERSKILLLGMVNLDQDAEQSSATDFSRQKQIAGDLVQQAHALKNDLNGEDQRKLSDLVSDLEVILLQIANLESEHDMPAVEMIRAGVDRKAILLKINLTEMQREMSNTSAAPEIKKKKEKTGI